MKKKKIHIINPIMKIEITTAVCLSVSSPIGYVDENSKVGTIIVDAKGNNITFQTTDADIVRINMATPGSKNFLVFLTL